MKDLTLHTTGDGVDFNLQGNRIEYGASLYNQMLLALFGGNAGHVTKPEYAEGEQRFDYWGNSLLEDSEQFNSYTQAAIETTVLNSSGLITIEDAAKRDLEYFKTYGNIEVKATYPANDKLGLAVKITEPNGEETQLNLIWDTARAEIITEQNIAGYQRVINSTEAAGIGSAAIGSTFIIQ